MSSKKITMKAFKGNDEKTVKVEESPGSSELLLEEKKLGGYKLKGCINCLFFNHFCKDGRRVAGKDYCMPRLEIWNKLVEERFAGKISEGEFQRREELLGKLFTKGIGTAMVRGTDCCENFTYIEPDKKLKMLRDRTYREEVRKRMVKEEEKWYWPEKKKKYGGKSK